MFSERGFTVWETPEKRDIWTCSRRDKQFLYYTDYLIINITFLFLIPSNHLHELQCDHTDHICKRETAFEAISVRAAFRSFPNWGFGVFFSHKIYSRRSVHFPKIYLIPFSSDKRDWHCTEKIASGLEPGRNLVTPRYWNTFLASARRPG